jgi:hypothetical protein
MRPDFWQPPIERSAAEQAILGRVRRAKLFVFLRDQRHQLFSEAVSKDSKPRVQRGMLERSP